MKQIQLQRVKYFNSVKFWVATICGFGLLLIGGCRYHPGFPVNQAPFKTVYVAPAVNRTYVAQAQAVLTRQVREELVRNGCLKLSKQADTADVILEMTIKNYGRSVGSVDERDPDTAKSLSLNMTVEYSLKDRVTGDYFRKNSSANASISISANDYAQVIEYQRLPQLTREVAKKLVLSIENIDVQAKEADKATLLQAKDSNNGQS